MFSALNTMKKELPNFAKDFTRFLHRNIGLEATKAASILKEGKASEMTREAVEAFSFPNYFDKLSEVAPLLTTTLVAAATKTKYKQVQFCVQVQVQVQVTYT